MTAQTKVNADTKTGKGNATKELINPTHDVSTDPKGVERSSTEILGIQKEYQKRINELKNDVLKFFSKDKDASFDLGHKFWKFRTWLENELRMGDNSGIDGSFTSFKKWCEYKKNKGDKPQSTILLGMGYPQLTKYMGLVSQPLTSFKDNEIKAIANEVWNTIFQEKESSPSISEWSTRLSDELKSRGGKTSTGGTGTTSNKKKDETPEQKAKKATAKMDKTFEGFEHSEKITILAEYIMQIATEDDIKQIIRPACSQRLKNLKEEIKAA